MHNKTTHPFTVDELRTLLHLATSRDLVPLYGDDEVGAPVVAKLEKPSRRCRHAWC